jgi:hypothetical protein
MKKAIKAFTVGDKLYNIERIHSKLIHLYSQIDSSVQNIEKVNINVAIECLLDMIDCFGRDINSHAVNNYRQSISQTKYLLSIENQVNKEDVFRSFCYMHSCYVKFRDYAKLILKRGCECQYQDVCLPILQIELERKTKAHNMRS